jgi:16S rRNA (cytosine967-C5)-methyltransferase
VNPTGNALPTPAGIAGSPSGTGPALSRLLGLAAEAVAAVRAGQSLTAALARCPSDVRPGVQSLSFHVLRRLGQALAAREVLVPKAPPKPVDALLLSALALLWPDGQAPYADHTLVEQAVNAATHPQRTPQPPAVVDRTPASRLARAVARAA